MACHCSVFSHTMHCRYQGKGHGNGYGKGDWKHHSKDYSDSYGKSYGKSQGKGWKVVLLLPSPIIS